MTLSFRMENQSEIHTPVIFVGGASVAICISEVVKDVRELSGIEVADVDTTGTNEADGLGRTNTVVVEVLVDGEVSCLTPKVVLLNGSYCSVVDPRADGIDGVVDLRGSNVGE